jgi:hypothetical protein
MSNLGVQNFYYTRTLPSRSVAIAKVSTPPASPSTLTDVINMVYLPGDLTIRKDSTLDSSPADFTAPDLMVAVQISGTTSYRIFNQFFEITGTLLDDGITPAFYVHALPSSVDQQVVILDLLGNVVDVDVHRVDNLLYHSLDGTPYRVRYVDALGYLHTDLLQYTPALSLSTLSASATTYVLSGRFLTVGSNSNYYIRFTRRNGYSVTAPYNTQPNTPWFPRVSFSLTPVAPEWATQTFLPIRPYLLATWVPGIVLDSSLIEFERKQIFYNASHLPDILVFDKDYVIKYALDGSVAGSQPRRGTLYNWQRGLIQFIDPYKARIQVGVELDPTDIIFGFYSYLENDVIYSTLDVNPFTNPAVKNKIIEFYYKNNGSDLFHYIYHQVIDPVTGPVLGATNDPTPATGTNQIFANLVVGTGIGVQNFTVADVRQRGGGLDSNDQDIPQAIECWDLGFWDGKPYPIGGTMAIYVPSNTLSVMSRNDIQSKIQAALPMGTLAIIHYYNADGTELV